MSELSRLLMVTGGNVTGLTDELARDGLVAREASPGDRRAWIVRLTPKGRRAFETMAERARALDPRAVRRPRRRRRASSSTRSSARLRVHLVAERTTTRRGRTDMTDIHPRGIDPALAAGNRRPLAGYRAQHFAVGAAATASRRSRSNRPERKNPLTFDSYAELRDLFGALRHADDVHGRRHRRRRRQLLLGRRRARDHRPAGAG